MARPPRPNAKRRVHVSLRVKVDICHVAAANPSWTPTQVAREVSAQYAEHYNNPAFEVSRYNVRHALERKDELLRVQDRHLERQTIPSAIICLLDTILKAWIIKIVSQPLPTDDDPNRQPRPLRCGVLAKHVRAKMAELVPAEKMPKVTKSWVSRFLKRNGLNYRKLFGESGSVRKTLVVEGRKKMKEITKDFHPDDTYNFDESAYFYRKVSQWTIAPINAILHGLKMDKSRVTMAVATNASGSHRLPLLILGTADTPVPFRAQTHRIHWVGDKSRQHASPLFHYAQTKKGWMTSEVFQNWLLELDETMRGASRQILLLVDNVSSHKLGSIVLTNVRVEFLPKNTTSHLQPMDQGIIKATKDGIYNCRDEWEYSFLSRDVFDFGKVDLFTACEWCAKAYYNLSQDTIRNAWRKADIIPDRSSISWLSME